MLLLLMNSPPAPPAPPVPIIRFMRCTSGMGGQLWSDATPREYGRSKGI